jgi:hypothetical protein
MADGLGIQRVFKEAREKKWWPIYESNHGEIDYGPFYYLGAELTPPGEGYDGQES